MMTRRTLQCVSLINKSLESQLH